LRRCRLGVGARGAAHLLGGHAGDRLDVLRRVARIENELTPGLIARRIAALGDELAILEPFTHHHVGHGIDHRHVGAGTQGEVLGAAT
jgi:hypothetical protein